MSAGSRRYSVVVLICAFAAGAFFAPAQLNLAHAESSAEVANLLEVSSAQESLNCLSDELIETVRNEGSLNRALAECRQELQASIEAAFGATNEDTLRAVLATIVAANFAEYGSSTAIEYSAIASEAFLNCGNTVILVGHLFGLHDERLRTVGFDGGSIGNHAQLLYSDPAGDFLLDPTVGIIAKIGFDDLLRGVRIPRSAIKIYPIKARTIETFRLTVLEALTHGSYRPSDFMYMHETVAEHISKGSLENYFTPAGIYLRRAKSMANTEQDRMQRRNAIGSSRANAGRTRQ